MSAIYLTDMEIKQITGKHRPSAQARALFVMQIPYKVRPDGRPVVSRLAYERALGDTTINNYQEPEPDFSTILGS